MNDTEAPSSLEQIMESAKKLAKRRGISIARAYQATLASRPDLYDQYLDSRDSVRPGSRRGVQFAKWQAAMMRESQRRLRT